MQVAHDLCWRFLLCLHVVAIQWRTHCGSRSKDDSDSSCVMNVWASRWPWPSLNTTQPHGDRRWPGPWGGYEMHYTAKFQKHPPPRSPARSTRGTSTSTTTTACRSSGARGLTASPASGRSSESRGTSWSRSSTLHLSSRFSTLLCRRQWTQWGKCWRSSTSRCLTSSRSSTCSRSRGHLAGLTAVSLTLCVNRRRQSSWWKCLGSISSSSDAMRAHPA